MRSPASSATRTGTSSGRAQDELLRTIVGPLGPYWSLAIEEQFYVLLTVAFLLCWRTARPIRWLTIVVVAGWFGSLPPSS